MRDPRFAELDRLIAGEANRAPRRGRPRGRRDSRKRQHRHDRLEEHAAQMRRRNSALIRRRERLAVLLVQAREALGRRRQTPPACGLPEQPAGHE